MDHAIYHPGPVERLLLTRQEEHRSQLLWDGKDLPDFRLRTNFKSYWDLVEEVPPPADVIAAIRDAGFHGVYQTGMMRHDAGLITAFVERWRPETHTFHFRFGEATVTLEDVYYILGIRITGLPVVHDLEVPDAGLVEELLGVAPRPGDIVKSGLRIGYLVDNFGRCDRLQQYSDYYETELLFHIRAHLLLIIGSLFPNSSGNRVQLRLLHYVRHLPEIDTYSWGSACLAYLYKQLCLSCIGHKVELCGSMTLLQIWIYERFTSLAPRPTEQYFMQHPRALRWMLSMSYKDVPFHSSRGVRYELDVIEESHFIWRPYTDSAREAMSITDDERALMTAPCPLIFMDTVEWCYTDRVTRQFGFLQIIPTTSPLPGHGSFHGRRKEWQLPLQDVIQLWHSRGDHIMVPPRYCSTRLLTCSYQYPSWYDRVTRRYIINPRIWSQQQGMQGTQGHLPMAAEGISRAYHTISRTGIAVEEPQVNDGLQILRRTLDFTGLSELHERLPPPPPPTWARRGARTRGGHTGRPTVLLGQPRSPHRDGWLGWVDPTVEVDSSAMQESIARSFRGHAYDEGSQGHAFLGSGQSMFAHGGGSQDYMSQPGSSGTTFDGYGHDQFGVKGENQETRASAGKGKEKMS